MPVRHNIDVMHVEKNVSDALLSILMNSCKSKDGLKARKDLEDMVIRSSLHTQVRGKRTYLPPAVYWLSKEEKKNSAEDYPTSEALMDIVQIYPIVSHWILLLLAA